MDLNECRKKIDEIDEKIVKLYEERMPLYRDLADYTLKNDQGYMPAVQQLIRVMRDRFGA